MLDLRGEKGAKYIITDNNCIGCMISNQGDNCIKPGWGKTPAQVPQNKFPAFILIR